MSLWLPGGVLVAAAFCAALGAPTALCLGVAVLAWLTACCVSCSANERGGALAVLVVAALVRAPFVASDFLSDDLHRYVWEARVLLAGFDPYTLAPDAPELAHLVDEGHARINHPSYRSIYPPLAQLFFMAVVALGGREEALRDVVLALDLGVVLLLLAWRRALGASSAASGAASLGTAGSDRLALAYAWCPLVVLSAGSGHVDALALLPLAGVGLALARGRPATAGALLGLAALAKVFPVLLLPWVLSRRPLRALAGFAGVVLAGFAMVPATGLGAPLGAFALDFAFNAPVFMAMREHLPGAPHVWVTVALGLWLVCARLVEPRFERGAALALLGLLLLSPTVHYWYLSWALLPAAVVLPAAVGAPIVAWAAASCAALYATYADAIAGQPFVEHRELTRLAVLAPFIVTLALVVRARVRRERPREPALAASHDRPHATASAVRPAAALPSFGVIVPARGEAQNLAALVPEWQAAGAAWVVVVDAPSGDGTQQLCESLRASSARVVYVAEPRRGYGYAVLAGLAMLRERGALVAVVCDADNHAGPGQVRSLLAPLRDERVALVCGARGGPSRLTLQQRLGNGLTTALIGVRFGRWFADLGPFRALRLAAWPAGLIVDTGYGVNVEQNVRALLSGAHVVEVRLDTSPRRHGVSSISGSLRGALRAGRGMLTRLVMLSETSSARRSAR